MIYIYHLLFVLCFAIKSFPFCMGFCMGNEKCVQKYKKKIKLRARKQLNIVYLHIKGEKTRNLTCQKR